MSIEGNTRRSVSLRSRWISELPVPLNSSKMTSSIREPVSTSAVAIIVSDPPSSMLRAAPKKRFGRCSALLSTPPERTLPVCRNNRVVGSRQSGDGVEQDHDVLLVLHEPLGLLDDHLGDLLSGARSSLWQLPRSRRKLFRSNAHLLVHRQIVGQSIVRDRVTVPERDLSRQAVVLAAGMDRGAGIC